MYTYYSEFCALHYLRYFIIITKTYENHRSLNFTNTFFLIILSHFLF